MPEQKDLKHLTRTRMAKTGRTWAQWVRLVDAVDAYAMPHRDIARHLHDQHDVDGWWAQTVTVGYERSAGCVTRDNVGAAGMTSTRVKHCRSRSTGSTAH